MIEGKSTILLLFESGYKIPNIINYLGASSEGIRRNNIFNFEASLMALNLDYRVKQ